MVFQSFHNGINLGGWLSQYEFTALKPLTDKNLKTHFDSFITEGDIRQIAAWGFDHIRLPVSGYLLYDQISHKLNEQPLTYVKKCIGWCQTFHLNMVLDLHDFYGNVYGAMDTPMPLLTNPALQGHFLTFWTLLSGHLKKYGKRNHNDDSGRGGIVIAFELLNEVSDASHNLWNQLYKSEFERGKIMKKHLGILCSLSLILVLSLTACVANFDGSRTGNENEFVMNYKIFNTTDSQDLIVEEGDTIHVEIIVEGGSLSFRIQKDDEVPVYEGKDVSLSDEFDIEIEESGTYVVTVTGEKAKGSISFTVVTNQ